MSNVSQQSSTLALTAEDLAYIHELIAAEDVADESRHLDEEPPKGILFRLVSSDDVTVRSQKDAVITQMAQALRIARTTLETIVEHDCKNLAAKNSVRLIRVALAAAEAHEIRVPGHPQLAGFDITEEDERGRVPPSHRNPTQRESAARCMKDSAEDLCSVPAPPVGRALTESARSTRFKLQHCGRPLRVRRRGARETWREVAHNLIEQALHAESLRKRYRRQGATESQRRSLERLEQHVRDICDQADEYCLGPHRPAGRRHHK